MEHIKRHWRLVTVIYFALLYLLLVVLFKQYSIYLPFAIGFYVVVTVILFLGTLVGIPGIILHSFLKKEDSAMPFYKAALGLGSTNINIMTAYGLLLLRNFQMEEALDIFKKAKEHSHQYLYTKNLTGNISLCYWKMGKTKKALSIYEKLFYFPDLPEIVDFSDENIEEGMDKNANFAPMDFVTMGYFAYINDDIPKAIYYSKIAIELADNYAPAYDNLGQIAYSQGDFEEAEKQFKKALKLDPTLKDSLFFYAKLNYDLDRLDLAKKYLSEINESAINGLSTITLEGVHDLKKKLGLHK